MLAPERTSNVEKLNGCLPSVVFLWNFCGLYFVNPGTYVYEYELRVPE